MTVFTVLVEIFTVFNEVIVLKRNAILSKGFVNTVKVQRTFQSRFRGERIDRHYIVSDSPCPCTAEPLHWYCSVTKAFDFGRGEIP